MPQIAATRDSERRDDFRMEVEQAMTLALSVRQPWPWLMFNAAKDVENRSWATRALACGPALPCEDRGHRNRSRRQVGPAP